MASDKYNKAVNRANGIVDEDETSVATIEDAAAPGMVLAFDSKAFTKHINDNDWEVAPQAFSMKPGQVLCGILEGNGPVAELVDSLGVTKEVATWILASADGRVRISILSSVQLDKKLPAFVGGEVRIARAQDENIGGGKRYTPYLVAGPKLKGPDGKVQARSWSETAKPDRQLTTGEPS